MYGDSVFHLGEIVWERLPKSNYLFTFVENIKIDIIYNEVLTDQDKMSNFIYRSLDHIEKIYQEKELLYDVIKNNISNIKIKEIRSIENIR